jgi:cytidyltransferase-related domain
MHEIVVVSGGFDPIHSGHIKLIKEAAKHGDVVVLLILIHGFKKER